MTKSILLDEFSLYTERVIKDLVMPTRIQSEEEEQTYRPAFVFKMRLPDSKASTKKAPYILNQIIAGVDQQQPGEDVSSMAQIRSVFCVYCEDEQEGGLMLLNLMERVRINLLKDVVIGNQFELDLEAKLECGIYPDDTAPYYVGEMLSTWKLPIVKREVREIWQ